MPKGEDIYASWSDIVSIFLKVGGFLFVNKIGINAPEVITEINMNGSKFFGLLKFKNNIPHPIAPYRITIYRDRTLPLFLLLALSFNQLSATV